MRTHVRLASFLGVVGSAATWGCSDDAPSVSTPPTQDIGFEPRPAPTASQPTTPQTVALWGDIAANSARPMVAGTLTVTSDGTFAVSADSERDVIYVVDLASRKARRIALEPNDEPGRVVSGQTTDAGPHAYAVLRRTDAVVDLDLNAGTLQRVATCKAPRGIAYDEAEETAYVACASGEVVTYSVADWSEQRRVFVASDLKDIEVVGGRLLLTRHMSAEVLVLDDDGSLSSRVRPNAVPGCAESTVAHRLVVRDGFVYLAHQSSASSPVAGEQFTTCDVPTVASVLTKEPLTQFTATSESAWQSLTSLPVVEGSVLAMSADGAPFAARFVDSSGPLDFALGANGRVAISLAGNYWVDGLATIVTLEPEVEVGVERSRTTQAFRPAGMLTSVVFDQSDKWVAFSREPAALYFEDQNPIFLGGASVDNSAYSLLYMNSGAGISCVSCHPEGGHDDHVWNLENVSRLTLPLRGARTPFNWDHSIPDMASLLSNVFYRQMHYPLSVTTGQAELLHSWLGELPLYDTGRVASEAVERGQALFVASEIGCSSCHVGDIHSDGKSHDVETGGLFATPALTGLAARTNFLHDGCAGTLEEVFGFCGGTHQSVQNLKREQVEDLLAFLASL